MYWKNSEKLRFEITGTLPFKRDIVIDWLQNECDYRHTSLSEAEILIVGDKPGSKIMKAIEKKIEIVYAADIFNHFGEPTMPIDSKELAEWFQDLTADEKENVDITFFHEYKMDMEDFVEKYSNCLVETFYEESDFFNWIKNRALIIKEIIRGEDDRMLVVFQDAKEEW